MTKYHGPIVKATQAVNPLETAIKRSQVGVATFLINECGLSPMSFDGDFKETLLELSAKTNVKMFETIISGLQDVGSLYKPVSSLMQIFNEIKARVGKDEQILLSSYKTLIDKILG